MQVLGINCLAHDTSAALVVDGQVVAFVEEERLSREKHTWKFPDRAISWCLATAGLSDEPWSRADKPSLAISREVSDVLNSAHEIARAEQAGTVQLDHLVRALKGR